MTPSGSCATNVTYDALGREVEAGSGSSYTQFAYGPQGNKLALMNGQTLSRGRVPLPGGGTAIYTTGLTLLRYWHADWLGSARLATNIDRTFQVDTAYAPFGEQYADTNVFTVFTGQENDTTSNLYDFPFRKYDPTSGRWISPDPAGLGAADLTNPQSLNRYAYALNNPTTLTDPSGLRTPGDCDKTNPNCPGPGRSNYGGINDAVTGRSTCNLQFNSMPCYPWNASQEMLQGLAAYTANLQLLGTGQTILPNGTVLQWAPGGQVSHTFSFGGADSGTTAQGQWQTVGQISLPGQTLSAVGLPFWSNGAAVAARYATRALRPSPNPVLRAVPDPEQVPLDALKVDLDPVDQFLIHLADLTGQLIQTAGVVKDFFLPIVVVEPAVLRPTYTPDPNQ